MHSYPQIYGLQRLFHSGPQGDWAGRSLQIYLPSTACVTSTKSLPSLNRFYLGEKRALGRGKMPVVYYTKLFAYENQTKNPGAGVPGSPRKLGTRFRRWEPLSRIVATFGENTNLCFLG